MTEPAVTETNLNLKAGLAQWAQKNNIRPSAFARAMGYNPAYGWAILRGNAPFTIESVGRFVMAYGLEATREMLTLAGLPETAVSTLPHPEGAQAVPVLTLGA